jgi:hypothetical protein
MFAFLRRLATLEAAISLPVRPFPAQLRPGRAAGQPAPVPARVGPSGVKVGADQS